MSDSLFNLGDIGGSFASLPPNLQTVENKAFYYAFDKQMAKILKLSKKPTVWTNIRMEIAKYFDYMALCIPAPYYLSEYTDEQKLNLLKSAMATNTYSGTMQAVEEILQSVYDIGSFVPWYEYGGEPYHFKIQVDVSLDHANLHTFTSMLKKVKAARSLIDAIEIKREATATAYTGGTLRTVYELIIKERTLEEYASEL